MIYAVLLAKTVPRRLNSRLMAVQPYATRTLLEARPSTDTGRNNPIAA